MATLDQFANDVLDGAGLPINQRNLSVGVAWAIAEGSPARFDPWDTTMQWPGGTDFPGNPDGVKNFATYAEGVAATVATLLLNPYTALRVAFATVTLTAAEVATQIDSSPWGTKDVPGVLATLTQGDYLRLVNGSTPGPTPVPAPPPTPPKTLEDSMLCSPATGGLLVARPDGSVYADFGAGFHGSSGQINPAEPPGGQNSFVPGAVIVGIASTATGDGYWLVDAGGGIYCFGDAQDYGPTANFLELWNLGEGRDIPVIGIAGGTEPGVGYIIVGDGGGAEPATYQITTDSKFKISA